MANSMEQRRAVNKWHETAVALSVLPPSTQDIINKERRAYLFNRSKLSYLSMSDVAVHMRCKLTAEYVLSDKDVLRGCRMLMAVLNKCETSYARAGVDGTPYGLCVMFKDVRMPFQQKYILQELLDAYALQLAPIRRSVWWFYSGYDNVPYQLWFDVRRRLIKKVIKLYKQRVDDTIKTETV